MNESKNASNFGSLIGRVMKMGRLGWLLLCASLLLPGCSSIGPPTIARDRYDFGSAIATSWQEQTLLNIVKIRYMDMPLFVDIATVNQGYNLSTSANIGSLETPKQEPDFTLRGGGSYAISPAISYVPIKGNDFTRSFMTPIPPSVVLFLIQNGWPVDLIMPLTVDSINGLRGQIAGGANQRLGDREFYRVVEILRDVQKSGEAGMQIQRQRKKEKGASKAKEITLLSFQRKNLPPEIEADLNEMDELLGLPAGKEDIEVSFGLLPEKKGEIVMITQSMLSILVQLAYQVDVPPEHVAEGRTVATVEPSKWLGTELGKLVDIKYSSTKPTNAIAEVYYRNLWFWIDDRDLKSKDTLLFVMILFSLTDSGDPANLPIITIPLGGD